MKNTLAIGLSMMLSALLFASPALAITTASASPAKVQIVEGSSFSLTVAINPQGVKNFAEELVLHFPADKLQVTGFSFAPAWSPLEKTGYDSIDNVSGTLIKTAGFPGGFSTSTTFGKVTFKAIRSGIGAVTIGSGSQSFLSNSQMAFTGSGSSFVITARPTTPLKKTVSQTNSTMTPAVPPTASPAETSDMGVIHIITGPATSSVTLEIANQQATYMEPSITFPNESTNDLLASIAIGAIAIVIAGAMFGLAWRAHKKV